jgi:two-component system chemotaxis response regulator CheB
VSEIPEVLTKWAGLDGGGELAEASGQDCVEAAEAEPVAKDNEPVAFTCPDCGGALLQIKDGHNGMQFRCHVGHRFSMESFSEAQADAVERAVWIALRKLREREVIHQQLAENRSASPEMKRRYEENAAAAARDIELLEQVLARM